MNSQSPKPRPSFTPEMSTTDSQLLEELLDRWEDSAESGVPLKPESLCQDCPHLLPQLQARIDAIEKVDAILQTPDDGSLEPTTCSDGAAASKESLPDSVVRFESSFVDLQFHERGGIGVVYRAVDSKLNRNVAIKFMNSRFSRNQELVHRFRQEAEITGRLDHPGVVPVYAMGQTDTGEPFYSMRFIKGDSLDRAIAAYHHRCGRVDPDSCIRDQRKLLSNFVTACRTIAYAHTRGIVHRDIKPQNIMIGKYGETLVVDWGLALPVDRDARFRVDDETTLRPRTADQIRPDMGEGTPVYMSPEQVAGRNQILPASDIFSLGVTMFKLLTGELAFDGDSQVEVRQRILKGDFPAPRSLNPEVAPELESICLKAMALDPNDRYETATDLADDVENWLAGTPVSAHHYTLAEKISRWSDHHRNIVRLLAAFLLLAAVAGVVGAILF